MENWKDVAWSAQFRTIKWDGGAPDVVGMRTCCKNYSTIGVNIVYCDKCSSVRLTAEGAAASETMMVLQVS